MLPALVLGVCVLAGGLLILNWFVNAEPRAILRALRVIGVVLVVVLVVGLAITRQLGLALLLASLLFPMLARWRVLGNRMRAARGPSPGQASDVTTAYLRARLDHDSGEIAGEVLAGRFAGRTLNDLSLNELMHLLTELRDEDPQSVQILEAFLDRSFGTAWRGEAEGQGDDGDGRRPDGPMTVEEAYAILGLDPGASPDSVKEAHRRLMKKLHPDQGGSDYLAAKLNEAKDLLLGR